VLNPVNPAVEHSAALELSGWGPGGRRFKSGLPDYESPGNRLVSSRVGFQPEILLGSNFTAVAVRKARRAARFSVASRTTGNSALR
jgi:hypothetical protein